MNAAIIGVGQSHYTRRPQPGQTALFEEGTAPLDEAKAR